MQNSLFIGRFHVEAFYILYIEINDGQRLYRKFCIASL